ncbi:unnamed protein product [Camellia sinensis]
MVVEIVCSCLLFFLCSGCRLGELLLSAVMVSSVELAAVCWMVSACAWSADLCFCCCVGCVVLRC